MLPFSITLPRAMERLRSGLEALHHMPYKPFKWRKKHTYLPTLKWLSLSFLFALGFMLPLYAQWLEQALSQILNAHISESILQGEALSRESGSSLWLGTLSGIISLVSVLFVPKARRFSTGFFIGVLWFYWIGFGLRYFDVGFLIPFVIVAVGLLMGAVFYVGLFCECLIVRLLFLLALSCFTPLGFEWVVPESFLAYSFFGVDKLSYAFLILGVWVLFGMKGWARLLGVVFMCFALDSAQIEKLGVKNPALAPAQMAGQELSESSLAGLPTHLPKIKLLQSAVPQDISWRLTQMEQIFDAYFREIRTARDEGYEAIVLPESAFYVPLDSEYFTRLDELLGLSHEIIIITGALRAWQDESGVMRYANSTYKIENGAFEHFDKVDLVPFGERLPSFLEGIASKFFPGVGGFSAGEKYGYFEIKGVRFKNAICYEGNVRAFYEDAPQYVLMTSNNAWFVPSLEPLIQRSLLKYYARLHGSLIYHATNLSPHAIITP